jgi:hypothetical protein
VEVCSKMVGGMCKWEPSNFRVYLAKAFGIWAFGFLFYPKSETSPGSKFVGPVTPVLLLFVKL